MTEGAESGQATSEAALAAAVLLLVLVGAGPALAGLASDLLTALGAYLDGFRFAWSLPVP